MIMELSESLYNNLLHMIIYVAVRDWGTRAIKWMAKRAGQSYQNLATPRQIFLAILQTVKGWHGEWIDYVL